MVSFSLWIDTANRRLVSGFNSNLQSEVPVFCQGDLAKVDLHLLRPTGILGSIYEELEISEEAVVRVAIGRIDSRPTSGSFRLAFQGDKTPHLPFNATAEAIQSALNALPSVAGNGNLTVQGNVGGPWTLYWNLLGSKALVTADTTLLLPQSQAILTTVRAGSSEGAAIQTIKLKQMPAAFQNEWHPMAEPDIQISRIQPGGSEANEIQRVRIKPPAYAGTFTLRYGSQSTPNLPFDASADAIREAIAPLAGIGAGNVSVTRVAVGVWDIQFVGDLQNAPQNLFSGNASSLRGFNGRLGILNLNTSGIENLLAGQERVTATLEVEITEEDQPRTFLQTPCIVLNDMIEDNPAVPIPFEYALTFSRLAEDINENGFSIGPYARLVALQEGEQKGLAIETLNPDGIWLRHAELTSLHP